MGCGKKPAPPPPAPPPVVEEPPPPPPPPEPEIAPLQVTTIYFDYDKSDIRSDARDILAQNAKSLTDHSEAVIRIEGHCDERGTDEYNMALGERRANAARDYLVNYGIDAQRMSTISYGESRPAAPGHDEGAWSQNRRAEFTVVSE
ncbi:MAG: peptidoglycan-associated lipoprotein [candidate division Zixibacteria bacterium RBG_16_53_22]|nr:MAG: peptidoglycan-associated lipoprotein [candidate division Zixibacteria bacterium RBG_16_53_22]